MACFKFKEFLVCQFGMTLLHILKTFSIATDIERSFVNLLNLFVPILNAMRPLYNQTS